MSELDLLWVERNLVFLFSASSSMGRVRRDYIIRSY